MSFIVQPVQTPSIFRVQSTETGGAAGKVNFDVSNYDILYYEGDSSGDFFLNVRGESATTLSSLMNIGDVVDISLQVTNGGTNKTLQYLEIDSGAGNVSLSMPSGQTSFQTFSGAITIYDFSIEKSSSGTYFVEAQVTRQELPLSNATGVIFSNVSGSLTTDSFSLAFSASGSLSNILYAGFTDTGNMFGVNSVSPVLVPITAPGTYTLQVGAYTVAGISSLSSASNSLTISVPSVPTNVAASGTNGTQISVSFTPGAPGWTGAGVTYYAESTPGGFIGSASASPILVSGTYSGSYTFEVYGQNAAGIGITSSASNSINVIPILTDYLVVGGGGGGGGIVSGGGGAGGFRQGTGLSIPPATIAALTVGGGGPGAVDVAQGTDGTDSVFYIITSTGGGGGGAANAPGTDGRNGGSGGGSLRGTGGSGNTPSTSPSQGNNGGTGSDAGQHGAGGGGGASAVGGTGTPGVGGAGGAGAISSILGTSYYWSGGGGGSAGVGGVAVAGNGGIGGGGGAGSQTPGVSGTGGGSALNPGANGTNISGGAGGINTGGGGGGCAHPLGTTGGAGGSGIVIIKYPTSRGTLTSIDVGLTYSLATLGSDYIYTFTQGTGNITFPF